MIPRIVPLWCLLFFATLSIIYCDSDCSAFGIKPMRVADQKAKVMWHSPGHDQVESVYGFTHAIEKLWQHQNPQSCKGKKFLIWPGHLGGGFGSNIHVEASILAIAMNHDRIYVRHPVWFNGQWPFQFPFCKSVHNRTYDCYYEPVSSCTLTDVFPSYDPLNPSTWPDDNATPILKVDKVDDFTRVLR